MNIYILRHGETDWNAERRIQGHVDIPLNATGVRQARGWRSYFERIRLQGVYSSALSRAIDTARLATGRPPCVIEGFNERHYGAWEGGKWEALVDGEPELRRRWRTPDFRPPGGESRLDLAARVEAALREVVDAHKPGDDLLIVCHGGSSKAILALPLGLSVEKHMEIDTLGNASMAVLSVDGGRWRLLDLMSVAL